MHHATRVHRPHDDGDDDDNDDDDAVRLFRTVQLFHTIMGTEEHITMV